MMTIKEIDAKIEETNTTISELMIPVNAQHDVLRAYEKQKRDLLLAEYGLTISDKLIVTETFYAILEHRRWSKYELDGWTPGAILELTGHNVGRKTCSVNSISAIGATGAITIGQIIDMRNAYLAHEQAKAEVQDDE